MLERAYGTLLGEPLKWIVLAVFQPTRFHTEYEPTGWQARARMQVHLVMPLLLLASVLVILVRTVLLPAHLVALPDETHLVPVRNVLVLLIGVAFGLACGPVFALLRPV